MFHGCDVASTLAPILKALIQYYTEVLTEENEFKTVAAEKKAVMARVEKQMAFLHPGARKAAAA